jgi:NAD-dependent SIR2 family protein deacetylase
MRIIKVNYNFWQCEGENCKNDTIDYLIKISQNKDIALCEECYDKLKKEMERAEK